MTAPASASDCCCWSADAALSWLFFFGPWPSFPPPFAQQSDFMWPFFLQLKHSTSFFGFFFFPASAPSASSCPSLGFLRTRRSCSSSRRLITMLEVSGVPMSFAVVDTAHDTNYVLCDRKK